MSQEYMCTHDEANAPLCPHDLCLDEECQYCEGFARPKNLDNSGDTVIKSGFDVETAGLEPTEEMEEQEENFYTEVYGSTKETMEGTYETVEGFFGTKTQDDVEDV